MNTTEVEAVFVDRDGTVGPGEIDSPFDFLLFNFTLEAIKLIKSNRIPVYMFTNQACIARGKSHGFDFYKESKEMLMDGIFLCPHDDEDNCDCRKPKTGLLLQAREKLNIDLSKSIVIGDRWSDMVSGGICKCKLILVLTGRGEKTLQEERKLWFDYSPCFIAENLLDAAKWITKHHGLK